MGTMKCQDNSITDILRIRQLWAQLWYPKNRNKIWRNLEAGFRHKPNSDKNTCLIWISQGL